MEEGLYNITNGDQVIISRSGLLAFLTSKGFRKLRLPQGGYSLVQLKKNSIITDVQQEDLMQTVIEKVLRENNAPLVFEKFLAGDYLSKNLNLAFEQIRELNLNLSTPERAYFFFSNAILLVRPDSMELIEYENYEGLVHESQIIGHDIVLESTQDAYIDILIRNVTNRDEQRYRSLTSAIGYMLHSYKDPALTKAIILVDEEIDFSGEANGGTGKSLIARAVQSMTSSLMKDGKSLNQKNNRFFYQDLTLYHRVLILDDVTADFDFEGFFSVITDGLEVEQKYKASYRIPFQLSPKVMITSNYMVRGSGGNSDERRRMEIEIYPHYHSEFTPSQEFGHRLFSDWGHEEWNNHYLQMVKYLQEFMRNGLVQAPPIKLTENKLMMKTDPSFVEFADGKLVIPQNAAEATFNKGMLYSNYRDNFPVEARNVTASRFKKWLDEYCKCRRLEAYHFKSNSESFIRITKN